MSFDRITFDPASLSGQPCIRGMRLTVRRVLEALGFSVLLVEDASLSVMREAIDELAVRLIDAGHDAVALVYFAGHGIQERGINYLLPVDAALPTRAHLAVRTLSLNQIVTGLARGKRKASVRPAGIVTLRPHARRSVVDPVVEAENASPA